MKLSQEELSKISEWLCNLATECSFMYDSAKYASRIIGCYVYSFDEVEYYLQDVLRRYDILLDDLHRLQSTLEGLLVQHQLHDDEDMI